MPLFDMSPNIQEGARKRSHGDFLDNGVAIHDGNASPADGGSPPKRMANAMSDMFQPPSSGRDCLWPAFRPDCCSRVGSENLPPLRPFIPHPPPEQDSPASLVTDGGSSEPAKGSPSPTKTPSKGPIFPNLTAVNAPQPPAPSTQPSQPVVHHPPVKRKRLTPEEKAAKLEAELEKKREREEAKAAREAEKQKALQEKLARAQASAELRRQKEEKERKEREEKERKEKSQLRLNSFFVKGPVTPKKAPGVSGQASSASPHSTASPSKAEKETVSDYDKMFKPFFVKDNVTVATKYPDMDEETRQAKSLILDEYLSGRRQDIDTSRLSAIAALHVPGQPRRRGRRHKSVKEIMAAAAGTSAAPIDLTTELENAKIMAAQNQLKDVPMKYLFYREDVRPAYWGTITSQPLGNLQRAAKRPNSRCLPAVNYDYDSEAEWVDDEGEDILDDGDDEEEDGDDEDMAEFLDDSEAVVPSRAPFLGAMEPESTGICFETETRWNPSEKLRQFKLEIILGELKTIAGADRTLAYINSPATESLDIHASIDPFTSSYWEPEPKPVKAPKPQAPAPTIDQAAAASTISKAASIKPWVKSGTANPQMPPPAASNGTSSGAIGAPSAATGPLPGGGASTSAAAGAGPTAPVPADPKKMVRAELLEEFKRKLLQFSHLSKIGLVELISAEMPDATRNQVKYTIEAIAVNDGAGGRKTKNDWKLREGWGLIAGQ